MKKPMAKKVLAAITAAAMTMSVAACGDDTTSTATSTASTETSVASTETSKEETVESTEVVEEEVSPYTVLKDANGNVYDLGGMEIIIRDWWSGDPSEPANDFQEAQADYREWIQETYNFTIKQQAISDWGSTPSDFVDYATTGGDENYVFAVYANPAITSAIKQGLVYDLSTLDCLDFSQNKFKANLVSELYSINGGVYAMYLQDGGYPEARDGVFFNKRVLTEAGIDPDSLYDMQADGTWTWDAFEEMCATVQRDTDNDGVDDVYGLGVNEGNFTTMAVVSNNGSYIGKDDNGYYYNLESAETLEALEWAVSIYAAYDNHDPEGAEWNYYYDEFLAGKDAFLVEGAYCLYDGGQLSTCEDEVGFVMFPKGPQADTYVTLRSCNLYIIPACYDAEKAWNIAFAYDLYMSNPPGYEDYCNMSSYTNGMFDSRALNETIPMMLEAEHGVVTYEGLIPNLDLGPDLTWNVGWWTTVSETVESIRDTWKAYVDEANQ